MTTLISERPQGGPSRPYVFPEVTRAVLPGGEVVAAHLPGQRMAYAGVLLEAGVVREPAGKEGVGKITADLLREGTLGKTGDEFALALESLGASWSGTVDADILRVGVQAQRKDRRRSLRGQVRTGRAIQRVVPLRRGQPRRVGKGSEVREDDEQIAGGVLGFVLLHFEEALNDAGRIVPDLPDQQALRRIGREAGPAIAEI